MKIEWLWCRDFRGTPILASSRISSLTYISNANMPITESLSRSEKVGQLTDKWKAFPNLTTFGAYEYFSQTIHLPKVTLDEFSSAFAAQDYASRKKVLPLFRHEQTHWLDHITTLWGNEFLINQFNAVNARLINKEENLWSVVELMRLARRLYYADYYSVIYASAAKPHDGRPWKWQLACRETFDVNGRQDPTMPIAFMRFQNSDDEDVARVPFSIASLLEVNAMAVELATAVMLCDELEIDEEKMVEANLLSRATYERLYDPLLTVYSVAAHFFANRVGFNDWPSAYFNASKVAGFLFYRNFPRSLFPQLKTPPEN